MTCEFLASETFDELSELKTPHIINQMEDDSPCKNKYTNKEYLVRGLENKKCRRVWNKRSNVERCRVRKDVERCRMRKNVERCRIRKNVEGCRKRKNVERCTIWKIEERFRIRKNEERSRVRKNVDQCGTRDRM